MVTLDAQPMDDYPPVPDARAVLANLLREHGGDEVTPEVLDRIRATDPGLARLLERNLEGSMRTTTNLAAIMRTFSPRPFHGDLLCFVAEADPGSWRSHVTGEIEVHALACNHQRMLGPEPAEAIGKVLRARLTP